MSIVIILANQLSFIRKAKQKGIQPGAFYVHYVFACFCIVNVKWPITKHNYFVKSLTCLYYNWGNLFLSFLTSMYLAGRIKAIGPQPHEFIVCCVKCLHSVCLRMVEIFYYVCGPWMQYSVGQE